MRVYTFEEWIKLHPELLKPPEKCEDCNNTQKMQCEDCDGNGKCPHCGQDCETCDGDGTVGCEYCSKEGLKREALATYKRQRERDEKAWEWLQKVMSTHTEETP